MGYVLCEHLRRIYLSYLVCEKDGIDLFLCEHCFFVHSRSGQSTLRTQTDKLFCHSLTRNNFSFHFIFVKKLKLKRNCVRHMKLWNGQQ